ncbi:Cell division cycle protein [Smittium culicis]|uniref:Cell division cycle protein n=1 Tax=Smittium culicis TaxID=133412 RepID=A0A1R1XJG3_9FUNG|nr:Cell division cycle protein [Smittium culicis]
MKPSEDTDEWSDHDDDIISDKDSDISKLSDTEYSDSAKKVDFDEEKILQIKNAISSLGGKVIPRMNWSAPTDAVWIATGNTLECENVSQILLLLKSSDKISNDMSSYCGCKTPFSSLELKPQLVLRQSFDVVPSMVFRCYVKNKYLIAISQIDCSYYEFLDNLEDKIEDFIYGFFASMEPFGLDNYCFDLYLNAKIDRAVILDFDPWYSTTSPLLFTWDELNNADSSKDYGLRLFPKSMNMGLGSVFNTSKYSTSRFPVELTADSYYEASEKFFKK